MSGTSSEDLERKLKTERVEACLNCQRFTKCDDIGQFVECAEFMEVEAEKAMVIIRLDEYARLGSSKKRQLLLLLKRYYSEI